MKKTRSKKSRDTVPLKQSVRCENNCIPKLENQGAFLPVMVTRIPTSSVASATRAEGTTREGLTYVTMVRLQHKKNHQD
jgi:hypothetical protein